MKSQEANAIPLREILEKYGHEPVRSYHGYLMYSSPFRNEETPQLHGEPAHEQMEGFR